MEDTRFEARIDFKNDPYDAEGYAAVSSHASLDADKPRKTTFTLRQNEDQIATMILDDEDVMALVHALLRIKTDG